MLLCFCAIGAKAADINGSVKFNPGVRYSQWAINSRAHDFYANTTPCGMATIKDGKVSKSSFGKSTLDYVPGLVAKSMIEATDYYQNVDWSNPWFLSVKEYGDKYYGSVENTGGSLDNLNAVKLYIGLYNNINATETDKNNINATETDKNNYKTAISRAQAGLVAHNNSYSIQAGTLAGNAVVGGWFHKTAYNNQMWLDGAYMGSALLAQIVNFNGTGSNVFGSTTADWDMVFKQLNIVWNMCWNANDKLMYHAFEANAGTGTSKSHADTWAGLNGTTEPYTFHSAAYWGRANAWYLMALVDVLEAMKNAGQENTTNYTTLKQHLADLAAGIAARQDVTTGGWYQVMNKDASFKATSYNSNWNGKPASVTNYIETSATAIFAAAYFKAVRCGLLESTTQYDYKTIAKNAFEGLVNNYTYLDANGDMQIWGSCKSAGLGGDGTDYVAGGKKYRDGSNEYYLLGYDVPMVKQSEGITEGKVLGGFIMAATEYERAYQNQDSKQILFARDLAPSYDFTTTAGTLDATAYGNGTVSYQWYKSDGTNETKIADATSATYTPTESGSYYCIATANGNTIKTSETTVTAKSNSNTDNGSTDNNGGSENGETTTIFSLSVNTGANASVAKQNELSLAEYATITGGSASVYNGKGSAQNMIVNGSITYTDKSTQYVKITLNKALTKGDVITIATSGSKIYAAKDNSGNITNNIAKSPYTVDDNLAGATVLYLSSGDKGKTISSITITRPVKKYTVSATAGTGGSVTIANASGATVTSDTEVEANTSLTFTATPSDGYVFVNWTDASNKEVSTNATYTRTVTAAISLTANFKAKTPVDPTESGVKPVFLESFKGITINLNQDSKNRTITVPLIHDGEDVSSYFKYTYTITPTGNTSSVTGSTLNFTPETAGTYTVTVSATPDSDGTDDYSDVYDNPEPIIFTLKVDSKNQTISVTPDPTSIKMYAGTTRVAPDLTVKTETTTLDDTEYNTLWFSTSPGIVKVDANTGEIEAVSEGTAKIRVVVTGDNLESTTALITVEVDDPAMYRVKGSGETYKNHTRMWNQDKNMSVVLGGWLFSDDVKEIVETPNTSSEGLSAKYHWGPGASKAKWKLTGFDYYVAGDNNKNARQENGSNALPETTNIYSADFVKYKGTIKDNMFNVPCSGSYLEFNPVTNGKVTVHIFQNGAFDAKTTTKNGTEIKEYQYRPQRRVFVMDEAGNFVESTAHIESTNGKPTGGIQTIDKYKWDLDSKTLTIEDVRSHFKGIPTTFDMTAEAFKNNVYESNLSTDLVPNAAAGKGNGSMGWSVLADSPVTYTFNVKAGKTYYLYNFGSKIGFYGFSFDETKPTVDEVSYADDLSNTITATAAGHVAKVTVNRSMKKDVWTTCVLPFSLNRQQVDAIFGPAYSAAYPQGTQILYFDRVEGNKVFFVRHAYNTIVAGKPFLIKPTEEVTSINTAEVPDYPYVTIENTKPEYWCSANGYAWASSYSNDMTVKVGDGFISNNDGSFKNFVGESGTLKGFRGYLKRLNTQAGAKPMMLQVVSSSNVDGDNGETTGIEDLIIDADGQLMPTNGKVYNINGQLVSEDANSFQSLPSGIYIINGKKYIK